MDDANYEANGEAIAATDTALTLIERLKVHYGALMFVQSRGCCDGSSPMCLRTSELLLSPNDLLLGTIAGCPFFIDREQFERWGRPRLVIDVSPGASDTFSLEGREGVHFIARTPTPASSREHVLRQRPVSHGLQSNG